ncbi:uncharacterized protein LOC135930948 [Gordionus sp. m RMFG-2023]|uniref:uncharacterized protein LOC135930948 n=1 Tax=Gordionus sp. m RMFG-2023 TaxID=3053472 RepID=UPI0031FCF82C
MDHEALTPKFYECWMTFTQMMSYNEEMMNKAKMVTYLCKPFSYTNSPNENISEYRPTKVLALIFLCERIDLTTLFQKLDTLWDKENIYNFANDNVLNSLEEFLNCSTKSRDFSTIIRLGEAVTRWLNDNISTFNIHQINAMSDTFSRNFLNFAKNSPEDFYANADKILKALSQFWKIWLKYPVLKLHSKILAVWNETFGKCRCLTYPDHDFKNFLMKEACLHISLPVDKHVSL